MCIVVDVVGGLVEGMWHDDAVDIECKKVDVRQVVQVIQIVQVRPHCE